jgi:hypothetical protein
MLLWNKIIKTYSSGFRFHSCRNAVFPVESSGIHSIIPADSSGFLSFLQECEGHQKVLETGPDGLLPHTL